MSKSKGYRSQVQVVDEVIPEEKKEEVIDAIVEAEVPVTTEMPFGEVTCEFLNVRKEPVKDTKPPVAVIVAGTKVKINEAYSTDEWYKVELENGYEGFCMKQFIKVIN